MRRFLGILFTLLLVGIKAFSISLQDKYSYLVVLEGGALEAEMSDSLFYKISRKVIFPVNKFDIPQSSPFRHELIDEILPYFNNNDYILQSVVMRGAASPEGPYAWNQTLSQRRRKALLKLISDNVQYPLDSCLTVKEVPEDYVYLLLLMKEKNDPDYDRVARVVNEYFDTDQRKLKQQLMADKALWKRLLRDYFPEMRAARIVLVFRKREQFEQLKPEPLDFRADMDFSSQTDVPPLPSAFVMPEASTLRIPRREVLSVKTNLLYDFAYMPFGYNRFCPIPNIAIEYYPLHGHFTYGASFDCPWWQDYRSHKYFQVRNYQLEARYYFKSGDVDRVGYGNGAAFRGWYAQAYAHLGLYGICFDENRGWEGEGFGGGLGVGYVLPLSRMGHWRLEFGAQFGVFYTKYDPYQYESVMFPEKHDDLYYYKFHNYGNFFSRRQHRLTWFGPTRVGVTLTYDLLYRRRAKKGVSFKSWEEAK